jgi:hypothetical protein
MAKSKSKLEEARQFLDDLDSLSAVPPSSTPTAGISPSDAEGQDPAEELAFIDKITQKPSEPSRITGAAQIERPSSRAGTPTIRKSSERVRLGGGKPSSVSLSASGNSTPKDSAGNDSTLPPQTSGWGWGSVWSSASAAIQQAKTVVDEQVINQVRNLPANEQARKVLEYAKATQLDKFGSL